MNGIDTSAASLLASRIGALGPTGSQGSAGTAQTGVSALAGGAIALPDAQGAADSPQASAQTVLSAVALALDAIIRSGGEATPAVVGRAPVWADPDAADASAGDAQSLPLPGLATPGNPASAAAQALEAALLAELDAQAAMAGGAQDLDGTDGAANTANPSNTTNGNAAQSAQGAQNAAGVALAAQSGPVAALAASLAQTVANSGLFYESHLAQWLRGQRLPGELADEPQNRLTGGAQLPLDWSEAADDIDDVFWTELPGAGQQAARAAANAAAQGAQPPPGAAFARGEQASAAAFAQENARSAASAFGDTLLPAVHVPSGAGAGVGVHEALLPLVRQQLDLLATGEFRWTGEAWPGVRLDWTIQPEDYDARDPHGGRDTDEDATPWHTRLTLSLPSLGTVDAELTLTGATLAVRVQASPGGAQRLTDNSEVLRGRLEALGLSLAGLSIREIGGVSPHANAADAARAADAYARNAAAPETPQAAEAAAAATSAAAGFTDPNSSTFSNSSTDWERG